jgi:DNA polymerase I-like protein with 3'-5' exonuclease and polymerase domains
MSQGDEFEFQCGAAAYLEREQGTEGGQKREHAYDAMTAARKTLCFLGFFGVLSKDSFNGSYAVNHPVQGSCAEVMQIALARLDKALRHEPAHLIATVHDEVVMLVPDDADAVGRIGGIAQREMVAAFVEVFPNAPTIRLVEPKVGQTWGDLESVWLTRRQSTV